MTTSTRACHIHHPPMPGDVGFVFICPGSKEVRDCGPVKGTTGANLDKGLAILKCERPDLFPHPTRTEYLVTNASTVPLHRAKNVTGTSDRTTPGVLAVLTKQNIERLKDELGTLKVVIACGEEAQVAVRACKEFVDLSAHVVNINHTSDNGLGRPKAGNKPEAIKRWAKGVLDQLPDQGG